MKLIAFLCLMEISLGLTFPANYQKFTNDIDLSITINNDVATFFVRKNRKGFLSWGFGKSMSDGDVFLVQTDGGKLTLLSCKLIGQVAPNCSANGLWGLVDSQLNSDGTWAVQVTRNIKVTNGITINSGANDIIYNYSDSLVMNGHVGSTDVRDVKTWNLSLNNSFGGLLKVALATLIVLFL